jgi:hypothetical protein
MVGAIHGRLLTAWSAAGVLGPVLVSYIRDYQLDHGVAKAQVYSVTMFILAGLLGVGLLCNWRVKPVDPKHFMTAEQLAATAPKHADGQAVGNRSPSGAAKATAPEGGAVSGLIALAWLAVWIPLGWGIWVTLQKAVLLFK